MDHHRSSSVPCGRLLMLLVAVTTAAVEPHGNSQTIHIGYFMAEDPHRAAAMNIAIERARHDGMLSQYNFRYSVVVVTLL